MKSYATKSEALKNRPALLPAPFPVGARVRYLGTRNLWIIDNKTGEKRLVFEPGSIVTILRVHPPKPQYLEVNYDEEAGDYYWSRNDGYSVFGESPFGRIIWPEDAHEWERV